MVYLWFVDKARHPVDKLQDRCNQWERLELSTGRLERKIKWSHSLTERNTLASAYCFLLHNLVRLNWWLGVCRSKAFFAFWRRDKRYLSNEWWFPPYNTFSLFHSIDKYAAVVPKDRPHPTNLLHHTSRSPKPKIKYAPWARSSHELFRCAKDIKIGPYRIRYLTLYEQLLISWILNQGYLVGYDSKRQPKTRKLLPTLAALFPLNCLRGWVYRYVPPNHSSKVSNKLYTICYPRIWITIIKVGLR